jgi:DNA polymerase III sliding clamp (beta) subunit (PCNA family)
MIKTASLLAALNIAKSSLGSSDSVYPVLAHFCFMGDIVYAYNDQTAIIVEEDTGLNCALHGETLLGILAVAGAEEIAVKISDGAAELKLKSGWVKVPALDESQFMFVLPDEEPILTVPFTDEIATAIERCLMSVNTESVRAEFTGVSIRINQSGITFFSSDNATATRYVPEGKFVSRKVLAAVIPQAACEQMLKLRKGDAKLKIGEKFGVFESDGVTLLTKLAPANISIFESVFATHTDKHEFWKLPEEMAREIAKANVLLGRESVKECVITFAPTQAVITAAGILGSMKATVNLVKTVSGPVGVVRIDPTHVLRAIQYADKFTVTDQKSLVLAGGSMSYVVSSKAVVAEIPPASGTIDDDIPQ